MKIALVQPPDPMASIASNITQHPINLLQLAAYIQQFDAECEIWDYTAEPWEEARFAKRIQNAEPEIIGFSCVTPKIKIGAKMARLAKQTDPDILTLVGGPHLSAIPKKTLEEFPAFDLGVIGEGELTLAQIIEKKQNNKPLAGIEGTVFREGDQIKQAPLRPMIKDLDTLPYPNRDLIDFSLYAGSSSPGLSTRIHSITELFTSRGCPVRCIFCGCHVTHQGKVRFRSADHVLGEVHSCIEKYGVDHFTIDDDTFTYGRNRLSAICNGLSQLPVTWDCDSRVDSIDKDTIEKMAKAGCVKIAFGVESGSPRILKLIQKRINREQIENAFSWCRQAGIQTSGFLMVGSHPSETVEDLNETLRFMKKVRPDFLMVYCAVPYPGTELNKMMAKENLILSSDWDEYDIVRSRPVWKTEHFSPDDLVRQQQRLYRSYYLRPGYVIKKFLDLRNWEDFRYLFESGVSFLKYIFSKDRLGDHST